VREVADRTGLHPNTARFHLDALADADLVSREPQPRGRPGRPSVAYRAKTNGEAASQRRYRLLAEMLTGLIAGMMPGPGEAATEAGRQWGRYLTEQPPPYQSVNADEAIARLTATMTEIGFAPEIVTNGTGYQLRLRRCPFREVAEHHQDVVCQLHLGLLRGVLDQMRAPVTADQVQPFAEPSVCTADLAAPPTPASSADSEPRASAGGQPYPSDH
jgi:predicted ArsR family transcriptional regulator